jgi:transposase
MSLPKDKEEELFGAQNILNNLLPDNDPMVLFSKEVYPVFNDDDFKECYSKSGRNAISPAFLALVTILQWKESLSDPEASEACVRRLDWKIALHLPVKHNEKFDSSTLCYFRRRLKENDKMCLIFDKILELVKEKGFIKKRTKQRIDATHIISHVNRISTTDLLFRSVKCVVEEIERKEIRYYENNIPEHIKERYSQNFSSFGLSKAKRGEKQAELVEDGLYIKRILKEDKPESLKELKQLAVMEKVFEENVIIKQKEINERIFVEVKEIECPKQTIFDPRDPSIKLGKKGKKSWVGSKCHIVETAERGKNNFITNMIQQEAPDSDRLIHEKVKEGNEDKRLNPKKVYVDSNYISGKSIREYEKRKQKLMGYIQKSSAKKHPDFQLDKFQVDVKRKKVTCPKGHKSVRWYEDRKKRVYSFHFNKEDCQNCDRKKDCLSEKAKKRQIQIIYEHDYIRKRRKEQEKEKFKKEMAVRAQIEGTISELCRFHGLRYARYKGEKGRQLQYLLSATGLNVKRLLKALMAKSIVPAMV